MMNSRDNIIGPSEPLSLVLFISGLVDLASLGLLIPNLPRLALSHEAVLLLVTFLGEGILANQKLVVFPEDIPDGHVGVVDPPEGSDLFEGSILVLLHLISVRHEVRVGSVFIRMSQIQWEVTMLVHHVGPVYVDVVITHL